MEVEAASPPKRSRAARRAWVMRPNFMEDYVAYYTAAMEQFQQLLAGTLLFLSHAMREGVQVTRTSRVIDLLRPFNVFDLPLWLAEDVPHNKQGVFKGSHYVEEYEAMHDAMVSSGFLQFLVNLVDEGRVVAVGYASQGFLRRFFCEEMENGSLPMTPHYSHLNISERCQSFHDVVADLIPTCPSLEAFAERVAERLSETMTAIWAQRGPDKRRAIGDKQKETLALRSPEKRASIIMQARETWAAKSDEEMAAIIEKANATRAANSSAQTPEVRAAKLASRRSKLAKKTPEQRKATKDKMRATRAGWSDAMKAMHRMKTTKRFQEAAFRARLLKRVLDMVARRTATPELRAAWLTKLRAGIRGRTTEQKAARHRLIVERYYAKPGWHAYWSAKVMAQHARKTPEQRAAENAKHKATCAAWTPEFRLQRVKNIKASIASRTPERKLSIKDKFHASLEARTPEKQAEVSANRKKAAENQTPETKQNKSNLIKAAKAAQTPEQRAKNKAGIVKAILDKKTVEGNEQLEKIKNGTLTPKERFSIGKNGRGRAKDRESNPEILICAPLEEAYRLVEEYYKANPSQRQADFKWKPPTALPSLGDLLRPASSSSSSA